MVLAIDKVRFKTLDDFPELEVYDFPIEIEKFLPISLDMLLIRFHIPNVLTANYIRKGLEKGKIRIENGVVVPVKEKKTNTPSDFKERIKNILSELSKLNKEKYYQTSSPYVQDTEILTERIESLLFFLKRDISEDFSYLLAGDGTGISTLITSFGVPKERIVIIDIDKEVVNLYRKNGFVALRGDIRFLKDFLLPFNADFLWTYHIEEFQTKEIVSFADTNLKPYGVWYSYISQGETERKKVYEILEFIEKSGFIVSFFDGLFFRAVKIPYPERKYLSEEWYDEKNYCKY